MPLNIWFLHFNLPNQQGWGDNHGVLFFQIRIIISLVPQGGLVCEECPLGLSAFLSTRPPKAGRRSDLPDFLSPRYKVSQTKKLIGFRVDLS